MWASGVVAGLSQAFLGFVDLVTIKSPLKRALRSSYDHRMANSASAATLKPPYVFQSENDWTVPASVDDNELERASFVSE